jgi:hypothetical protein
MTAQDLFLGMVLAAFATFILTLGGVTVWLNHARASDNA